MKILLIGAGAVGMGIASTLIKSGAELSIVARGESACMLEENGIRREGIFGEEHHNFSEFVVIKDLISTKKVKYD